MKHRLTTALLVWFFSSNNQAFSETLNIAVASNFISPMKSLAAEFEQTSKHKVRLSFGSSGKLYAQIQHGAPFDAFFSADQTKPEKLLASGYAVKDTNFTYAIGKLSLCSSNLKSNPKEDLFKQLKQGHFNKLALANPKLAPYGQAAYEVLSKLNLVQSSRSKWVVGENVAQTYQFVQSGNAQLGFIALSQFQTAEKKGQQKNSRLKCQHVPASMHEPIKQNAVVLNKGKGSRALVGFTALIKSESGKAIIRRYGYSI